MDDPGEGQRQAALKLIEWLHVGSPLILLVYFLVFLIAYSILTAERKVEAKPTNKTGPGGKRLPSNKPKDEKDVPVLIDFAFRQKLVFVLLGIGVVLTFFANAALIFVHALVRRNENWWCGQPTVIYVVVSFCVYSLVLISLIDMAPSPTIVQLTTWLLGVPVEIVLLGASLTLYTGSHQLHSAKNPRDGPRKNGVTDWEAIEIIIDLVRIILLVSLIAFYGLFMVWCPPKPVPVKTAKKAEATVSETTRLLSRQSGQKGGHGTANGHAYGTTETTGANGRPDMDDENASSTSSENSEANGTAGTTKDKPKDGWSRPDKIPSKSWWEYIRGYSLFFPYLWPAKSTRLQITVGVCFMLVLAARVINVLVPYQVGKITDALAGEAGSGGSIPWGGICLYIVFRLLQGNNGLLGAMRATLWVPISQYSYRELSIAAFEHVHGLSLDFHLNKKTGEVISALSKGNSINTFLEQATFQVVPMMIDLAIAVGYFLVRFDVYYALVVAIIAFAYLYLTIRLAQWRADIRREMVNFSRQEDAIKNDSIISYETVKYFNAEDYEFNRYRHSVDDFLRAEEKVLISLNIMNVAQNIIFALGLLITCFIAAFQVTTGQRGVGDFTALVTYMAQLQAPLNFFGTFYRSIQSAMINSERMLELFKELPSVVDEPGVAPLTTCQGDIRWTGVQFGYDQRKPALDDVSFHCAPGTTTALVGESGGGKSTIFRLLYRYYNPEHGSIEIDGHDIRDVSIDSYRSHIGVVPQDTVLFNETIMYNLKYARPDATDEEVFAACEAASIHTNILNFPDGYDARVGDRGLKLSGGEKQRVAIARTILKNPRIILLDEATAALDNDTEHNIQYALHRLLRGRTTLVIAHRLSTITGADQILVLHAGGIAERGTHSELLELNGRYASMWRKQVRAAKAAQKACMFTERGEDLQSGDQTPIPSDDDPSTGELSRPGTSGEAPTIAPDSQTADSSTIASDGQATKRSLH